MSVRCRLYNRIKNSSKIGKRDRISCWIDNLSVSQTTGCSAWTGHVGFENVL